MKAEIKKLKNHIGSESFSADSAIDAFRGGEILYDGNGNRIISEAQLYEALKEDPAIICSRAPATVQVRVDSSDDPSGPAELIATGTSAERASGDQCGVCGAPFADVTMIGGENMKYCAKCKNCDWPDSKVKVSGKGTRRQRIELACDNGVCRLVEV